MQPRKIRGWQFFDDNIGVCDVVEASGIGALKEDDRRVAEWFIAALAGCRSVVDVGCGAGFPGLYVSSHVDRLVGVDAAPNMIAAARRHARELHVDNASFEVGGDTTLRFPDHEFDGVMLCGLLESMDWESVNRIVPEVLQMLAPGGRVAALDQDWADVLARKPREERSIRYGKDRLVLCCVGRTQCLETDTRYLVRVTSSSGEKMMSELGGRSRVSTQLSIDDLNSEDVVDAWYEEAAQFDAESYMELFSANGFKDIKIDRLSVWGQSMLMLQAAR